LPEAVEHHQDATAAPEGHQGERHGRVAGRLLLRPAEEGGQGIAAVVDGERPGCVVRHPRMMPGTVDFPAWHRRRFGPVT
jgi:hypothetical protein